MKIFMNYFRIIGVLLLSLTMLAACDVPAFDDISETSGETVTETSPTVAENVDSPYAEIENGTELWLKKGLDAYLADEIPEFDAAAYFAEPKNLIMLTLYNDMFNYDRDAFESVSALVFRHIMDEHGYDALFDLSKRIKYKDEWIKTIDPSLSYVQNVETEVVLSAMVCDYDVTYENIVTLEGAVYYFYSYHETVDPSMAHFLMYHNTLAVRSLREVIAEIDPDGKYFDTTVPLEYVMELSGGYPAYESSGYLFISKYEDLLSAAVGQMLNKGDEDSLMIAQGLAEIYGKTMDLYYLTTYDRAFYLNPTYIEDYFAPYAATEAVYAFHFGAGTYYYSENGVYAQGDDGRFTIDNKLYTHAAALSEADTGYFYPISDIVITSCDGRELSRNQAASFVLYLIEQTSEEAVLEVYSDYGKFEETFGGDYEAVKAEWMSWLVEKFGE